MAVLGNNPERVWIENTSDFPGGSGSPLEIVNAPGTQLDVQTHGEVDQNNSSTTPLGIGGVFTGTSTDILHQAIIFVNVYSDVASATDGLLIQQSSDGVNWRWEDVYSIPAATAKTFSFQPALQYLRIQYTNGSVGQSVFDLQVVFKSSNSKPSSHRIQDSISTEDDAELVKSVITAEQPNGFFVNINSTTEGSLKTSVVSPLGSLPVSQLTTLFDGKLLNREMPEIIEVVGTGTETYSNNKYNMSVTAGQYSIIQSRRYLPYYSGKPQKVELTFDGFAPETDIVKRVGYFSSNTVAPYNSTLDGFWLESSGGSISIKAQRAGATTIDVDMLDWANYISIGDYQTLSTWDNFTVIEFNFLWLGGAYIELRLVNGSGFVTAHQVFYAGTSPDVFILSPNQPVRYEVRSTTGSGSFRYICNQVATAGSVKESNLGKGVDTGQTAVTMASTSETYPVIAIKKGTSYLENPVQIKNADLFVTTNDRIKWTLQINPTLSSALTYSPVSGTAIEKADGDGSITVTTDGIVVASGYLSDQENIDPGVLEDNFLAWLSGSIDGTQDEYVLCCSPVTSNAAVNGAINIGEG